MYDTLVQINDRWSEDGLRLQVTDASSRHYGGVADPVSGVAFPSHVGSASFLANWAASLVNPDSRYYRDGKLLAAFGRLADFMLNRQHADGTISLGSTNYHSPPDTGFVVCGVAEIYRLLQRQDWEAIRPAADKLKLFLERTIPAMLTGGCHTPNHRWVLTAALALLYELFGLPELAARAEEWLAEGMDMTADGEWTERSNGIYNPVSDISLIHAARIFGKPELLDCVRRNLRMMVYLLHPSGEVVTDYSGRQDFGKKSDLSGYFLAYRLMAAIDGDPLFAAMSDLAAQAITYPGAVNNNAMLGYLLYPETRIDRLERAPLPDRYHVILNEHHPVKEHLRLMQNVGHHGRILHSSMHTSFGSPIVRIRDKEFSATIMTRTPSFLSLRHGKARLLGVKLATSFSPGIVAFDEFSAERGVYKLAATLEKGYNGPIPADALRSRPQFEQTSPWYLLPHQLRPMTHLQRHTLAVEIEPVDSEWTIRVKSDSLEDVFTQLTFILGEEGSVSGPGLQPLAERRYFLKSGSFTYAVGDDALDISAGAHDHWLPEIREDQHPDGCLYVHVNLLTPFEHVLKVRMR